MIAVLGVFAMPGRPRDIGTTDISFIPAILFHVHSLNLFLPLSTMSH